MEVVPNNTLLPGDPRLIEHIVCELKSQGIFDQFRKECIDDVDTKPAYQNLRQRVEGSVTGFLKTQAWRPDMNKNQLREMLRKNIYESGFLETGVERIVDQVVYPKINSVFLPQVEDVVYNFLGLEKPVRTISTINGPLTINTIDLLPTDLDPISPDSEVMDKSLNKSDKSNDDTEKLDDSKNDEFESPPFEPITEQSVFSAHEESSNDSHLSGISGLTSHDSNMSCSQDSKLNIFSLDVANQDSQLSKVSSNSRLSIITTDSKHNSEKMDISDDTQTSKSSKLGEEPSLNIEETVERSENGVSHFNIKREPTDEIDAIRIDINEHQNGEREEQNEEMQDEDQYEAEMDIDEDSQMSNIEAHDVRTPEQEKPVEDESNTEEINKETLEKEMEELKVDVGVSEDSIKLELEKEFCEETEKVVALEENIPKEVEENGSLEDLKTEDSQDCVSQSDLKVEDTSEKDTDLKKQESSDDSTKVEMKKEESSDDASTLEIKKEESSDEASKLEVKKQDSSDEASKLEVKKQDSSDEASKLEVKKQDSSDEASKLEVKKQDSSNEASKLEVKKQESPDEASKLEVKKQDSSDEASKLEVKKQESSDDASKLEVKKSDAKSGEKSERSRHDSDRKHSSRSSESKDKKDDRKSDKDRKEKDRNRSTSSSKDKDKYRDKSKDNRSKDKDTSKSKDEKDKSSKSKEDKDKDSSKSSSKDDKSRSSSSSKYSRDRSNSKSDSKSSKDSKDRSKPATNSKSKDEKAKSEENKSSKSDDTKKSDSSKKTEDLKKSSKSDDSKSSSKSDESKSSSSSSRSRDRTRSDTKHTSSSSSRDRKSSSSKDHKDRKEQKKSSKRDKDDHSSSKDKKTDNRRSADRDSNDGSSGIGNNSNSNSSKEKESSSVKSSENSTDSSQGSNSGDSGGQSDNSQTSQCLNQNDDSGAINASVTILTETSGDKDEITISPAKDSDSDTAQHVKIMKPKIASNIFEARRLMKVRKKLEKLEQKRQRQLIEGKKDRETDGLSLEDTDSVDSGCLQIADQDEPKNDLKLENTTPDRLSIRDDSNSGPTTSVVSKESWDALEAKLSLNVDYDSYIDENCDSSSSGKHPRRSSDEEDCLYFVQQNSPKIERYLKRVASLQSAGAELAIVLEDCRKMAPPHMNSEVPVKRARKTNQKYMIDEGESRETITSKKTTVADGKNSAMIKKKAKGRKRKLDGEMDGFYLDNNNRKTNNHFDVTDLVEDYEEVMEPSPSASNTSNGSIDLPTKIKPPVRSKKAKKIQNETFPLPLSPESDVSASSIEVRNAAQDKDVTAPARTPRASIKKSQRYSSDDLYKPRPFVSGSSRRQRGLLNSTDNVDSSAKLRR